MSFHLHVILNHVQRVEGENFIEFGPNDRRVLGSDFSMDKLNSSVCVILPGVVGHGFGIIEGHYFGVRFICSWKQEC